MRRLLPLLATFVGFVLLGIALKQGAGISLDWYWAIAAGAGFALAVYGLTDL